MNRFKSQHAYWQGMAVFLLLWCSNLVAADSVSVYEKNAQAMVDGMTARSPDLFNKAIDAEAIVNKALEPLTLDPKFKSEFSAGLREALSNNLGAKFVNGMPDGAYARLIRTSRDGDIVKALIRLDYGDNGTAYIDLHLRRNVNQGVRIVDMFNYSTGELFTVTLRNVANMAAPTPTILGRFYDKVTDNEKQRKAIGALLEAKKRGESQKIIDMFMGFDASLQKKRALNIVAIQAAQELNDEKLYLKTLGLLDKYHGDDPGLTFMLIDYHFMMKDYAKVISSLKSLEKSFGTEDAAIKSLMANSYIESGDIDAAYKMAKAAIELEPQFESSYWSLLNAQVISEKYAGAVNTSQILEQQFGFELSAETLKGEDVFKDFIVSPEFSKWRNERK